MNKYVMSLRHNIRKTNILLIASLLSSIIVFALFASTSNARAQLVVQPVYVKNCFYIIENSNVVKLYTIRNREFAKKNVSPPRIGCRGWDQTRGYSQPCWKAGVNALGYAVISAQRDCKIAHPFKGKTVEIFDWDGEMPPAGRNTRIRARIDAGRFFDKYSYNAFMSGFTWGLTNFCGNTNDPDGNSVSPPGISLYYISGKLIGYPRGVTYTKWFK